MRERPFWNYCFCPVYFVGILENGWGDSRGGEGPLLEHYRLLETGSGEDMNVDYNFVFLRLDRFNKREDECESVLEQYAYTLKNMGEEDAMPDSFMNESIMNLYDDAQIANLSTDVAHELIRARLMTTENDWLVAISEAKARAAVEGRAEGRAEGLAEGRRSAIESIARNFKAQGLSSEMIASATGLTEKEVDNL